MSELPEIRLLANQASHTLLHKTIQRVVVNQPKCLKESPLTFQSKLVGQQFVRCDYRGKYLCLAFGDHRLFLNFSMGGDFYFHENGQEWSEKYHLGVFFSDGSLLTLRNHWVAQYSICMNKTSHLSDDFGPNADHISLEQFICQANYCRATAKSFLLNQRRLAGIGNFYQHDILFLAKIHPASKMNVLNCSQLTCLHQVILSQLALSMSLGGDAYYPDLYGEKGGFTKAYFHVAYKEGEPCPVCASGIQKIRTGSTHSYICPMCQPFIAGLRASQKPLDKMNFARTVL